MAQITAANARSLDRQGNPQHGDQSAAIAIVAATSSAANESHSFVGGDTVSRNTLTTSVDLLGVRMNEHRADIAAIIVALNKLRLSNQAQGTDAGNT